MTNQLATQNETLDPAIMEQVVVNGDLSQLKPAQRVAYYNNVCQSIGLNPLTKPFSYIKLNGKLTLYAQKDATEQLRKLNGISISRPKVEFSEDLVIVSVDASDKSGRTDSDVGIVTIGTLKGDMRANAIMKAVTKAKRRVTLSISGLGWLNESEIETIPGAQVVSVNDDGFIDGQVDDVVGSEKTEAEIIQEIMPTPENSNIEVVEDVQEEKLFTTETDSDGKKFMDMDTGALAGHLNAYVKQLKSDQDDEEIRKKYDAAKYWLSEKNKK